MEVFGVDVASGGIDLILREPEIGVRRTVRVRRGVLLTDSTQPADAEAMRTQYGESPSVEVRFRRMSSDGGNGDGEDGKGIFIFEECFLAD